MAVVSGVTIEGQRFIRMVCGQPAACILRFPLPLAPQNWTALVDSCASSPEVVMACKALFVMEVGGMREAKRGTSTCCRKGRVAGARERDTDGGLQVALALGVILITRASDARCPSPWRWAGCCA